MPQTDRHILSSDIGGTSSRFAHFTADEQGNLDLVSLVWLDTATAGSFTDLLQNLRESEFPFDPRQVAIAVAGPITEGVIGNPPNIPWEVDITHAELDHGFRRAILINDFVAQAFSCISPIGQSAEIIHPCVPEPLSVIAVIGAGTGLGKAMPIPMWGYSLIRADTVNTMPPATLQAFLDHGQAARTIEKELEDARVRIASLVTLGVDLDAVTRKLLDGGVAAFAASFESLLRSIETEKKTILAR